MLLSLTDVRNVLLLWMFYSLSNTRLAYAYMRPNGVCIDSVYAVPGHTMCIANSKQRPIHGPEINEIEQAHDNVRASVTPKPSNMLRMTYLGALEKEAQIWAEQCTLTHDEQHLRNMPGRYTVGQNILISDTNIKWQKVVETWAVEKKDFQYGLSNNMDKVGNYTQMISAETTTVGCGMAACGGVFFYVCNYAPRGNFSGRADPPYRSSPNGQGADDCPNHVANDTATLCDCAGLVCLNGGSVDLTTCLCSCPPDNTNQRYELKFCELNCEPSTDPAFCLKRNKTQCKTDTDTFLDCPWLCNACPYAGNKYRQGSVTMPWTTTPPTTISTTLVGNGPAAKVTQASTKQQSAAPSAAPIASHSASSSTVSSVAPTTTPSAPSSTVPSASSSRATSASPNTTPPATHTTHTTPATGSKSETPTTVTRSVNGQANSQTGHDAGTQLGASVVVYALCMLRAILM